MAEAFHLYGSYDLYLKDVYYVCDGTKKIARITKCPKGWRVWYYTEKYEILRKSLTQALATVEGHFIKVKNEIFTRFAEPSSFRIGQRTCRRFGKKV